MGIKRFFIIVASTIAFTSGFAFAGVQGGSSYDDEPTSSGGGSLIPNSEIQQVLPVTKDYGPGTQTSGNCAGSASDSGQAGSTCWGYETGSGKNEDPSPSPTPKSGDKAKDDKSQAEKEAKRQADAEAAACRSQYQSALSSCESSISSASNSCDSSQNSELQSTASKVNQAGEKNTGDTFALACGEAGGVSQAAKKAMTSFRQQCNGGLESCRASCGQLTSFLQSKPNCYEAINHTSASAQNLSASKSSSCEAYQAKVNEADQSISNYAKTEAGSASCQASATGGQSEQGATNSAASPFCLSNPNAPGCMAATNNCGSDPSSLVCICSSNPSDSRCSQASNSDSSSGDSTFDSSSRLTSAADSTNGDLRNTPQMAQGRAASSGDGKGIDGRQSTADLSGGGGTAAAAATGSKPVAEAAKNNEDVLSMMASMLGLGDSGGGGGSGAKGADGATDAAQGNSASRKPAAAPAKDKGPDLRQFLPGGISNPGYSGITGSVRIGLDGITGPHSNIWQKIQNRYQVIQGTLEP